MSLFNNITTEEEAPKKQLIKTIKVSNFDDRYKLTDWLKEDNMIIADCTPMHKMDVLLLKEYISGFSHCMHGQLKELTDRMFLVTPSGFEIQDCNQHESKSNEVDAESKQEIVDLNEEQHQNQEN